MTEPSKGRGADARSFSVHPVTRPDGSANAAALHDACAHCARCAHWSIARSTLEAAVPGLASLGSAFGASAADTRMCRAHDRLTSPHDRCRSFVSFSSSAID